MKSLRTVLPFVAIAALVVLIVARTPSGGDPETDLERLRVPESLAARLEPGEVNLVKFGADWCPPCHQLDAQLAEVAEARPGIPIVDVDVDREPRLARTFGVRAIPLTLLIEGERVLARRTGAMGATEVLVWWESYADDAKALSSEDTAASASSTTENSSSSSP